MKYEKNIKCCVNDSILLRLKHILLLVDIELYNNPNLTTQILGKPYL